MLTALLVAVNGLAKALTHPAGAAGRPGTLSAHPTTVIDLSGTVTRARKVVVAFLPFFFSEKRV